MDQAHQPTAESPRLPDRGFYRITILGCLDSSWSAWFDGLAVTSNCVDGRSVIAGELRDQAALHGLLSKVAMLGLPLLAVERAADQG